MATYILELSKSPPADPRSSTLLGLSIATTVPVTVSPDTKLSEARSMMAEHRIRRLPVVKDEKLVGILSLGDVAQADSSERAVGETLEEISESTSTTEMADDPPRGTPERVQRARERE